MIKERKYLYEQLVSLNQDEAQFNRLALDIFNYQYKYNEIYRQYIDYLGIDISALKSYRDIPCMPISMFKQYDIKSGSWNSKMIFESSGTTGQVTSKLHLLDDVQYLENAERCFSSFLGDYREYCWLALLPSYLERGNSSLVKMVDHFICHSKYEESGFYLNEFSPLYDQLNHNRINQIPTILIGVSYALLDFSKSLKDESKKVDLRFCQVMETGGMKGRRKEMTREDLHATLQAGFNVDTIYSEYGMTELQSQAYSDGQGIFTCPTSMRVVFRDLNDPFSAVDSGKSGVLNVIDLANIDQCAFIETSDIGLSIDPRRFKVLGRLDASELRGCNLMYQD